MCGGFLADIVDGIVDIVTDVVDIVVDVVEDVVGWLTPQVDTPDFGELQADQDAKGVLVNKFSANSCYTSSLWHKKSWWKCCFFRNFWNR